MVNPASEVPEVQVESSFPCDRGLVDSIHGHFVGDKDQGVSERDHVADCLKGVIREPLFSPSFLRYFKLLTLLIPVMKEAIQLLIHSKLNFKDKQEDHQVKVN